MGSFFRQSGLVLLLAVICGGALAFTAKLTEKAIARNEQERLDKAILKVVPGGTRPKRVELGEGVVAYEVFEGMGVGKQIGWAVPAEGKGFQDKIKLIFGLSADGKKIIGLQILFDNETPGLGHEINSPKKWLDKFKALSTAKPLEVVKRSPKTNFEVEAITGATISSKAVCDTINRQMEKVREGIRH